MKRVNKHKLGFSLVEMVLVLAIICMLGGIIGGLCIAMSNSFLTTYNIDDSSDYASLFARGFENSFLAQSQKVGAANTASWYVNTSEGYPTLRVKAGTSADTAVFEPQFLGGSDGVYKWDVHMFYRWDEPNERVLYCVVLKDHKMGTDFMYFYQGGFWVPRFTDRNKYNGTSSSISVSGNEMGSYLNTIGYNTSQIPANVIAEGYYSSITYTP
jgi:prepilin-type N-terminal cleavage/methylation domain-containing protein